MTTRLYAPLKPEQAAVLLTCAMEVNITDVPEVKTAAQYFLTRSLARHFPEYYEELVKAEKIEKLEDLVAKLPKNNKSQRVVTG